MGETKCKCGATCGCFWDGDVWKCPECLMAERDRLVAALTPSANTKAAYHGKFEINVGSDEVDRFMFVPWTTIKGIMAAIRKMADARQPTRGSACTDLIAAGNALRYHAADSDPRGLADDLPADLAAWDAAVERAQNGGGL